MGNPSGETNIQQTNPLEPFLLLAKSAKNAAACKLVVQAVKAPAVFVFSELLSSPNISELANGCDDFQKHYHLLQLFACGTYEDYVANKDKFIPLDGVMLLKLRQLTIVTLAEKERVIPYAQLCTALQVTGGVRELEDLIIDAIYKKVLQGKLDQRNQCLHVHQWVGRDINDTAVQFMINTLTGWCNQCDGLLSTLEGEVSRANEAKAEAVNRKAKVEEEFINLKKAQKAAGSQGTNTPELDEVPSEVSSSRMHEPEKKHQKTRQKGGLRGSGGRSWIQKN